MGLIRDAMLSALATAVLALGMAPAAQAACEGRDLMAELPAQMRADLDRAVEGVPFARGTWWQAERDGARIVLIGTYHFDDPRHESGLAALAPVVESSAMLLVEASPQEEAALKSRLAADPSLVMDPTGPTLPEQLSPEDWETLSAALSERGIPPILASRMRPWYVSLMLGVSPCMMEEVKRTGRIDGLDRRLMDMAAEDGVPVRSLEPYDTLFRIFADLSPQEGRDMIRAALMEADSPDDFAATTAAAFFRGEVWALWEYSRLKAYRDSGLTREEVDRQMALTQELVMDGRNRAWIAPLESAAAEAAKQGKPITAAFGALHLPGENGVLNLLVRDGWTVTPIAPAAD